MHYISIDADHAAEKKVKRLMDKCTHRVGLCYVDACIFYCAPVCIVVQITNRVLLFLFVFFVIFFVHFYF